MRLAVIADVHGNYKALEAFLDYIEQYDIAGVICLGDYITDGPYPERVLTMIRGMQARYPCHMIRGNREEYMIANYYEDMDWKPSSAGGSLYYTSLHLSQEDIRYFETMNSVEEISIEGYPPITICHGTPDKVRGNCKQNPEERDRSLAMVRTDYLLGGHTHEQDIYVSQQPDLREKIYLNPGSLGLAVDGQGRRAQFAFLVGDARAWKPELMSIPYDVDSYLQDFTESGLDNYGMILNRSVKKTLLTGINYFFLSVEESMKRTGLDTMLVPEEIWQEIAEDFNL